MHFTRVRLNGFKSFVDPTELDIDTGLTGVVGPNGCGKSNLVEALRWVMGENAAKQVRGTEMDDMIFGGTTHRAPHNVAEVTLVVDNSNRMASPTLSDGDELHVTRRIERGKGSQYRVNGRHVRGRDVQLLFADAGTGARSSGMITQGQIGMIINARPSERRTLLEEAANIRGLHARRHEAELRLRGAETNLVRIDDILRTVEEQLKSLNTQARQAARYRKISDEIWRAEAVAFHARWQTLAADSRRAAEDLEQAAAAAADAARLAVDEAARRDRLAASMPAFRITENEAAADVQRLTLLRASLEAEQTRIARSQSEAELRSRQIERDIERETALRQEAQDGIQRLATERRVIDKAGRDEAAHLSAAAASVAEAQHKADTLETRLAALVESIATIEAGREAAQKQVQFAEDRRNAVQEHLVLLDRQAEAAEDAFPEDAIAVEQKLAAAGARRLDDARKDLGEAEQDCAQWDTATALANNDMQSIDLELAKLDAESGAIRDVIIAEAPDGLMPVIDRIKVESGYENALAATLGEDLAAPIADADDHASQYRWTTTRGRGETSALPAGLATLDSLVTAPPELVPRLSQIGVAPDPETARLLQSLLYPGQRLTTTRGGLWRWDGFVVAPDAPDGMTVRIRQRNRLAEITAYRPLLAEQRLSAKCVLEDCRVQLARAIDRQNKHRQAVRQTQDVLQAAHGKILDLERQKLQIDARIEGIRQRRAQLMSDRYDALAQRQKAREILETHEDTARLRSDADATRREFAERRQVLAEARGAGDRMARDARTRQTRLTEIAAETEQWSIRTTRAGRRIAELTERRDRETAEIARLSARPAEIDAQMAGEGQALAQAEERRNQATEALKAAERALDEAGDSARRREKTVSAMREAQIRAELTLERLNDSLAVLHKQVFERLGCDCESIPQHVGLEDDALAQDPATTEAVIARLAGERERIGTVNLRAEQEVAEVSTRLNSLRKDRDDLEGAIGKLRRGIVDLNREGRGRLAGALNQVNAHFQELFVRLFGGGSAHLKLVESDDPLAGGVEIMASPPGKRMQILSLLSGGEQALTALALVFAAFLTNPAPICVLDEADASLDDNNVARFCALLEHIVGSTGTRFLIITHHRLTMARMDRLYGVTMAERGVSQLVSVNLGRAVEIRKSA